MKTYGFDRIKMARNLTLDQLDELKLRVEQEHRLEQRSGIHLYDSKGLKKLDEISWAVYYKTKRDANDINLTC